MCSFHSALFHAGIIQHFPLRACTSYKFPIVHVFMSPRHMPGAAVQWVEQQHVLKRKLNQEPPVSWLIKSSKAVLASKSFLFRDSCYINITVLHKTFSITEDAIVVNKGFLSLTTTFRFTSRSVTVQKESVLWVINQAVMIDLSQDAKRAINELCDVTDVVYYM